MSVMRLCAKSTVSAAGESDVYAMQEKTFEGREAAQVRQEGQGTRWCCESLCCLQGSPEDEVAAISESDIMVAANS